MRISCKVISYMHYVIDVKEFKKEGIGVICQKKDSERKSKKIIK